MDRALTIGVQPAGTDDIVGFISAVMEATRTSPAAVPEGLATTTGFRAVAEYALDVPTAVTAPAGGAAVTVIVAVLESEPTLFVAVSLTV